MSHDRKTFWESLDVALTVTLKIILLSLLLLSMLTLAFCSEETVKDTSSRTIKRVELLGFRPTKLSFGFVELQAAATASTDIEAGNAIGLAADLRKLASTSNVAKPVAEQLSKLATEVEGHAKRLVDRDKHLISEVKKEASVPRPDAGPITGWVYLGRQSRTSGEWSPMSEKVKLDDKNPPLELRVTQDAVLVGKDPSQPAEVATLQANNQGGVIQFVRAGKEYLKILSIKSTPSIGEADLKWAQVQVMPRDYYEVHR